MTSKFILFTITLILGLFPQNIKAHPHEFYVGFPEDDVIGIRGRIINGKDAGPFSAPFIVSIRDGANGNHSCGGSILTKNTILTAAHCVRSGLYVAAGLYDRRNETEAQIIKVKNHIDHDDYKYGANPYDIGVLQLSEPLEFNDHVQPIDLPTVSDKPIGEVQLYGWGRTINISPILPKILQVATIDILTNEECFCQLPDNYKIYLHNTNVCTSSRQKNISACNADSGGPLVQKQSDGKTVLVGLVSWGIIPCGGDNKPSIFTHIGSHLDWIKKNTME